MSKINTKAVREQAVNMMGDLKNLVSLYMENDQEVAGIEGNIIWSREHKDARSRGLRNDWRQVQGKNLIICRGILRLW